MEFDELTDGLIELDEIEEYDDTNINHFAANGVLPLIVTENGELEEPTLEALVCSGISGGAAFENDMPKELTLTRRLADGTEYTARYGQIENPDQVEES